MLSRQLIVERKISPFPGIRSEVFYRKLTNVYKGIEGKMLVPEARALPRLRLQRGGSVLERLSIVPQQNSPLRAEIVTPSPLQQFWSQLFPKVLVSADVQATLDQIPRLAGFHFPIFKPIPIQQCLQ